MNIINDERRVYVNITQFFFVKKNFWFLDEGKQTFILWISKLIIKIPIHENVYMSTCHIFLTGWIKKETKSDWIVELEFQ